MCVLSVHGGKCHGDIPSVVEINSTFRNARTVMREVQALVLLDHECDARLRPVEDSLRALTVALPPRGEYQRFTLTAWLLLAQTQSLAGRHSVAIETANTAVNLYPRLLSAKERQAECHWALGNQLHQERQLRLATEQHLAAIELFPTARYYASLGADFAVAAELLHEDHDLLLNAAGELADRAIRADWDSTEWRLTRAQIAELGARIHQDRGDHAKALTLSQRAVISLPTVRQFYRTRMESHRLLDQYPQAVRDGGKALRLAPYDPELARTIADTRLEWAQSMLVSGGNRAPGTAPQTVQQTLRDALLQLNQAADEYASLQHVTEQNERLFGVRSYAHRRVAELFTLHPASRQHAIDQIDHYAASVRDAQAALNLDTRNEYALGAFASSGESRTHITQLVFGRHSEAAWRAITHELGRHYPMVPGDHRFQGFWFSISEEQAAQGVFFRFDNSELLAQYIIHLKQPGPSVPEVTDGELIAFGAAGSGIERHLIPARLLNPSGNANDPFREYRFSSPDDVLGEGALTARTVWTWSPPQAGEYCLLFPVTNIQDVPPPSRSARIVTRTIDWETIYTNASRRFEEYVTELRRQVNAEKRANVRDFFIGLGLDVAATYTTGGLYKVIQGARFGWETYQFIRGLNEADDKTLYIASAVAGHVASRTVEKILKTALAKNLPENADTVFEKLQNKGLTQAERESLLESLDGKDRQLVVSVLRQQDASSVLMSVAGQVIELQKNSENVIPKVEELERLTNDKEDEDSVYRDQVFNQLVYQEFLRLLAAP
ncbi:hypothetical protein GC176_12645 [bacterium]|nr:hypothetical protein [bacterium]